jgi:hypothetical protein
MTCANVRRAVAALVVLAVLGLAAPSAARVLEPLVVGWERIFRLDYEAAERRGRLLVSGYLANESPYTVGRVQLLVEALDTRGAILGQRVEWVPGELSPFTRTYFESPAPGPAPHYRVRVFAFDRIETHSPWW